LSVQTKVYMNGQITSYLCHTSILLILLVINML